MSSTLGMAGSMVAAAVSSLLLFGGFVVGLAILCYVCVRLGQWLAFTIEVMAWGR